ncbi:DUF983 domain-containing protein [Cytophaga hutchinsonii]|jgi:uncharacterized protein (DUF983 family)|uniref:DUF983 domain-containing protein n=1 Tax=Cytophaga hutchinsonii (strain ATCC 33406 / DSM 1761 / CIP 103989 / NBRC 15051 / NCIMB 9469 / D465) TaxID=269798 RepID=A0A6N4SVC1_CYTH3|nr:DUF983 domain-containing protein [Cytophaga hutchinsonii]ABG60491.1 hypothetical protein CHU_3252 [Cytophaga hutchinsonii ATCC 33406]SFX84828.1 Protein of unknown function [Cytophaga hutchinsonii ATCC 33406]
MKAFNNTLFALLTLKCPRCHKGKMFTHSNMYVWKTSHLMPEKCSCCEQPMEPETGFYYGAMYLSYALYVMLFVPMFMITVFFDLPYFEFFISFVVLTVLISPYFFRLSRACYLYLFVRYDKEKSNCVH